MENHSENTLKFNRREELFCLGIGALSGYINGKGIDNKDCEDIYLGYIRSFKAELPEKTKDFCDDPLRHERLLRDVQEISQSYVNRWIMYKELFQDEKFA